MANRPFLRSTRTIPERALANLLARDQLFTEEIQREATAQNLPMIEVHRGLSVDELVECVAASLGLTS